MSQEDLKVLKEILSKEVQLVMQLQNQNNMIIKKKLLRVKSNSKERMAHPIKKLKII